ncbi:MULTISPECIES: aminotransferase class I/II-fold pyridoxal phosphate-dependent enzyme [unclassified Anaerotruncus]|uniref:aminotransferase class I/II-fold pyridoxal phosphate-dependent enzyme n=1 Tax=unclassified Anaerotruncus TaxID=2641626 RepID=UPI0003B6A47B|nr:MULTISPECIES: aminotransferase class I/II-fold pyridoxal phosphate-dependent enzyme [unclassified Anaerotruncus]MCI9159568.1 aminotransferase class I/II-fold pyridoxal phosphate-dependent enzyme [Anaerotruncus sp.]NCE73793.1 aminotransferase class I/II-fold pyridoxal phosphate-dependent enzyme [Anaerotruncus sp. X29]RKJ97928.1 aminotransferase class I/II-fold pyridoxal phosphate-dependent enzyme [Anaerotruncus sp. 1XD22-93]MCI9235380.1 aminotransferase class I/II-fold pyridoxal phosphate-dep
MDYDKLLSRSAAALKPSGIRRFFDIAAEMDDVISLGVGEPDFKTPWEIRRAGIESLEKGHTFYTANAGLITLRTEICNYLKRRFTLSYDPKTDVFATVGGSEAIDLCIRATINPGEGEEVLIPEPCFVCYDPLTRMAGGVPVPIATRVEDDFRLTAAQLREHLTPKTKLLILPFPNNPTGAVMRRNHLEEIAEVLRGTDVLVLSDEIYAELTYGSERHVSIAELDGMRERTILVNGFSKAYAMTGWRLGYAAGPAPIIRQMIKLHQFAIMCSPTTSQYAAVEALKNCDEAIEAMRSEYDMRRRLVVDGFNRIGLSCFEPEGAFYVFPSIRSTGMTSNEFCMKLLEKERVAVVPGDALGASGEGHVRVSYSYSIKHLLEALKRIERFVKNLPSA